MSETSYIALIARDNLHEILSLLPVFSMNNAARVCKLWHMMIAEIFRMTASIIEILQPDTKHMPSLYVHLAIDQLGFYEIRASLESNDCQIINQYEMKVPNLFQYDHSYEDDEIFSVRLDMRIRHGDPASSRDPCNDLVDTLVQIWLDREILHPYLTNMFRKHDCTIQDDKHVNAAPYILYQHAMCDVDLLTAPNIQELKARIDGWDFVWYRNTNLVFTSKADLENTFSKLDLMPADEIMTDKFFMNVMLPIKHMTTSAGLVGLGDEKWGHVPIDRAFEPSDP